VSVPSAKTAVRSVQPFLRNSPKMLVRVRQSEKVKPILPAECTAVLSAELFTDGVRSILDFWSMPVVKVQGRKRQETAFLHL